MSSMCLFSFSVHFPMAGSPSFPTSTNLVFQSPWDWDLKNPSKGRCERLKRHIAIISLYGMTYLGKSLTNRRNIPYIRNCHFFCNTFISVNFLKNLAYNSCNSLKHLDSVAPKNSTSPEGSFRQSSPPITITLLPDLLLGHTAPSFVHHAGHPPKETIARPDVLHHVKVAPTTGTSHEKGDSSAR